MSITSIRPLRPTEPLLDVKTGTLTSTGQVWFNSLISLLNDTSSAASGGVLQSDYSANTILKADSSGTPVALAIGASELVGRTAASSISSLSAAQVWGILGGAAAITGGAIAGITDLAVADGGTGASSATAAQANLGLQLKRVSTQFDKTTDTTLATVTGLSVSVEAGKSYEFIARLFVDASAVGGQKYAISGTATATAIVYQINTISNTTNLFVVTSRQTALAGSAGQAGGTSNYTEIKGLITVNAAGTLLVQFAQNASSTTSSVLVGSTLEVREVT